MHGSCAPCRSEDFSPHYELIRVILRIPYKRIDGELGTNLFAKCQSFDRVKILNKKFFVKFFIILVNTF